LTALAVVAALEALDVGDIGLAVAILQGALEDEPMTRLRPRPCSCPRCGLGFAWPGLLDHHLRFQHDEDAA